MNEMMNFPGTWEEYEKLYGFNDSEEIYTNNSRLIPSFRVKQWLDHIAQFKTKQRAIKASDCVNRQAAIDVCNSAIDLWHGQLGEGALVAVKEGIEGLPSAEPERKKGKWIDSRNVCWMCSECGKWLDVLQGDADMNFCPNCGSRNIEEGEQDED